ncbi:MAG: MoxR family ATPase, partial [Pirellulales bacterium]|nr:MoxR family ATPase [Pirellulales bacterium]
ANQIIELQHIVRRVPVADHITRYAMRLARSTRKNKGDVPDFIQQYVNWGAGPRASQYMVLAAKARAVLRGRQFVNSDDIRAVAPPVLRHRIMTNFNAEAEGIKPDEIIRQLLDAVPLGDESGTGARTAPRILKDAAG